MRLPYLLSEVLMAKGSRLERAFALVEETTMSVKREAAAFQAVGAYLRRAHPHVVDPALGDMLAILGKVEADPAAPSPPRSGGTPLTGSSEEGSACDRTPQGDDDGQGAA